MENYKIKENKYEYKRKNRWLLNIFDTTGLEISEMLVNNTNRPILINGKIQPITISFSDPIGPSSTQTIFCFFNKNYSNSIKNKIKKILGLKNEKLNYTLCMLDPTNTIIEKWLMIDCKILKINFGNLDYTDYNNVNIEITIKPKKIKLLY